MSFSGRASTPAAARGELRTAGERRLVERVYERCQQNILQACAYSSVPPEFLGALTANESGGNAKAARFEPAVFRHLKAVVSGEAPAYAGIRAGDLDAEIAEMLQPKAGDFHARFLPRPSPNNTAPRSPRLKKMPCANSPPPGVSPRLWATT